MITVDTITDEQIKSVWRDCPNALTGAELMAALGYEVGPCYRKPTPEETREARARCAEILSQRVKDGAR